MVRRIPNYFAPAIARPKILEDVYRFRVQMPEGKLNRGGSKAWLAEAPHKPMSSYRRNPRRRTAARPRSASARSPSSHHRSSARRRTFWGSAGGPHSAEGSPLE